MKKIANFELSEHQLQKEMRRAERAHRRRFMITNTILALFVIIFIAVLAAVLWFPLFRVTGNTVLTQLEPGQVVLAYRTDQLQEGDLAAFYHDDKLRIQRVIASAGDMIDLNDSGAIMVDNESFMDVNTKNLVLNGSAVTYPYQVPDGYYFVLDDHSAMHDAVTLEAEFISAEQIAGKVLFRVWPISRLEYLG